MRRLVLKVDLAANIAEFPKDRGNSLTLDEITKRDGRRTKMKVGRVQRDT